MSRKAESLREASKTPACQASAIKRKKARVKIHRGRGQESERALKGRCRKTQNQLSRGRMSDMCVDVHQRGARTEAQIIAPMTGVRGQMYCHEGECQTCA